MTYDGSKAVTTAGTRVRLVDESDYQPAFTITIQALRPDGNDNTGNIYLGGATVSPTSGLILALGDFFTFPPQETNAYNMNDIWIDAANSGDGVRFIYSRR